MLTYMARNLNCVLKAYLMSFFFGADLDVEASFTSISTFIYLMEHTMIGMISSKDLLV